MIYKPSPNHSSRNGAAISMLILHATVGSYKSSLDWLRSPKSKVSTHYVIEKSGAITQLVVDTMAAWHAGKSAWPGRNSDDIQQQSIGIELVNLNTGHDPYPPAQIESCRLLAREKIAAYSIARADLVRHLDIATPKGRKTDPAGFPDWPAFVASCYPPAPAPTPTFLYDVIGLPIYQQSDHSGPLYGYLLPGAHVTIDDLTNGHLSDSRGFVDMNGLVVRPR